MTQASAQLSNAESLVSVDDDRWRPTRAGLLNVWQYVDEVLEAERGRLVLYGPNGSGKTMALELLLPHLLDAKGSPGVLSTSGADRGGLWERVTGYHPDEPRTGYLWLEFRRANGESFTLGVRLRAKPSGGGDKHWFTTSLRVGVEFSLLDGQRRPLTVEQLTAAIGNAGKVWGGDAAGYRNAVRATLFAGWSEDRIDALIRTLLVVRKQNVTDGLSPAKLSMLLSEALPPLDELELGRVADGFADLDRRRDFIAQLEDDIGASRRLADANRSYASAVVARVTAGVIGATTAFDNVTREVRRLSEIHERCEAHVRELEARETELDLEEQGLAGRLEGLESSDAYRQGAELKTLQDAASGAEKRAREATDAASTARDRAQQRRASSTKAGEQLTLAREQLGASRRELQAALVRLDAPPLNEVADEVLASIVKTWIDERNEAIGLVRACLHALELAIEARRVAHTQRQALEAACSRAEEALSAALQAESDALSRWRTAVSSWRSYARELGPLLGMLDEPATAPARVAEVRGNAREPLLDQRLRIDERHRELEAELTELSSERHAWLAGKDPEPEAPPGRRDRAGLLGAPLWRCLQFRDSVDEATRGSVEAALADARLLDAWIAVDGSVTLADDDADVIVIVPREDAGGNLDHTLAAILEPDPAAQSVDPAIVQRVLHAIGLTDGDAETLYVAGCGAVIGTDGSWRTERLVGRASLGPAQFIGATSREAARRARVLELELQIAELEAEQRTLQGARDALNVRLSRCDEEAAAFPSTKDIDAARRDVDQCRGREQAARDALVEATTRLHEASERVRKVQVELDRVASGHRLPTDPKALESVKQDLVKAVGRASTFESRFARAMSAAAEAARNESSASEAELDAETAEETARTRRGEHEQAASHLAAVEEVVGTDYRAVLEKVREVKNRRAEIVKDRKINSAAQKDAAGRMAAAEAERGHAEGKREAAEVERASATEAFTVLSRDGLIADAEVESPPALDSLTSARAILEAARRVRSSGGLPPPSAEEATLTKLSNTVMARVGDASRQLAGRADLSFDTSERGWSILRARREGLVCSAAELLSGLRMDLEQAQSELSRKQQELFEQILSGSVREHLKERLWAAQALVDRINGLLGQVRTEAGGVRVDLKWEIDPDLSDTAELRKAKELLLHDSPVAQGRADLDAFLRSRIEQVRAAEDDTGEWRERLARMLDYRQWHRFRVLVHHTRFGDTPRPLDSKRVSLSAGEKTMVMVLPLLAAVTAHYEPPPSDPPCSCPRLLLMDELFPKLDFQNKRKLIGLLPKLDLDAVFTSDKDRCEYDTLDGIAIHVFQKHSDDQTTTTRLVWNGVETRVYTADDAGSDDPQSPAVATLRS